MDNIKAKSILPGWCLVSSVLFIFILPFASTNALRMLLLAIAFGGALWVWRNITTPPVPLKLPFALWGGMAALSILWSVDPVMSFKAFKNEVLYTFISFFLFFVLTRTQTELRYFLLALLASAALMATLGIANTYHNNMHWYSEGYQGGVGNFSTYVVLVFPFIAYLILTSERLAIRVGAIIVLAILLYAGYLTLNRAMWLVLGGEVILFGIFAFIRFKKHVRFSVTGLSIFLGLSIFILLLAFHFSIKQKDSVDSISDSVVVAGQDIRWKIWKDGVSAVEENPWVGGGVGRHAFSKVLPDAEMARFLHSHNMLLDMTIQLGIIGVILFLFLLVCLVKLFWYIYSTSDTFSIAGIGACGMVLVFALLAKNMTDNFFVREVSLLFWSLSGMVLGYGINCLRRGNTS